MPHFYFDFKDGVTVRDRFGYHCYDENQAHFRADDLARIAALKHPEMIGEAYISVINDRGTEIYQSCLLGPSACDS